MCVGTMVVTRRNRTNRASAPWARTRTKRARAPARNRTMVVYDAHHMATHNVCRRHVVYIQERIVRMHSWYICATFLYFRPNCQRTECTNLHGCFVHCPRSQARHILTPLGRFVVPRTIRLGHSHPPLGRSSPVECSPIGRPIGRPKHRGPRSGSANLAAASSAPYRPEQSWQS